MMESSKKVKVNTAINMGINTSINMGIRTGISTGMGLKRMMSLPEGTGRKLTVGTEAATGVSIEKTVKMVNINIPNLNLLRNPVKGFLIKRKPSYHSMLKQHQSRLTQRLQERKPVLLQNQ